MLLLLDDLKNIVVIEDFILRNILFFPKEKGICIDLDDKGIPRGNKTNPKADGTSENHQMVIALSPIHYDCGVSDGSVCPDLDCRCCPSTSRTCAS